MSGCFNNYGLDEMMERELMNYLDSEDEDLEDQDEFEDKDLFI
jgi:hypothetical protein